MTTYYAWEADDGTYSGLARNDDATGWAVVVQNANAWATKPELLDHLIDGDISFGVIDQATADGLARKYGVTLDQPAEYRWDDRSQSFVSRADGAPAPTRAAV